MADSELEEGELAGEVAPEGLLGGVQHVIGAGAPPPSLYGCGAPGEQFLAPRHDGRAPYFADPDSEGWSGRRVSGGKKKRKKAAALAAGFVDVYGQGAAAALEVYPEAGPVRLADVQNLVLWVLAEGASPRWCFVKNKPLVSRVVLLVAHGLDSTLWESAAARAALPTWRARLGEPVVLQARNANLAPGSTVHSLLTVPQTKKRRREEEDGAAATEAAAAEAPSEAAAAGAGAGAAAAAAAAAAGATGGANNGAAGDTPGPAGPAAAKRMKVASADDVSTRIAPQLGSTAAEATDAAAGTAAAADMAVAAAGRSEGAALTAPAAAAPAGQQQQQPLALPRVSIPGGGGGARRAPCTLPPAHYVLTLDQLAEHGYPLPRLDEESGQMVAPEGYAATQPAKGAPLHDLVALDCEMCITDAGFELTRATLVDRQGQVLLDELVLPRNPITDHNTRYSGITAEMLEGVTTRLEDVRGRLLELVSAETLLVAHSGDNDLQALRLIHASVIDTSVLYPHPRGPPFKSALRVLASRHLLRTIQQGEHDPVEDARAALDLALLKFERGPSYGAAAGERGDPLLDVLGAASRRGTMVDRLEVLTRHCVGNCSAVAAEGDAAVAEQLAKEAAKPQVDFLWGQLTSLHQFYEARLAAAKASGEPEPSAPYRQLLDGADGQQEQEQEQQQQKQQADEEPPAPPSPAAQEQPEEDPKEDGERGQSSQGAGQPAWEEQQAAALQALDRSLAQAWDAAPAGTLFVVATGQGDTAYTRYLQEHKWQRQQGVRGLPPWSPECEAHLAAACDRALAALCFAAIKPLGAAGAAARPSPPPLQEAG